jgi:hypothetical protein
VVGGQRHVPTALPPGKTRYPLYRRLGGPQGRSGRVQKISSHWGSIPEHPARSESLYRLSYPGPISRYITIIKHIYELCSGNHINLTHITFSNQNFNSKYLSNATIILTHTYVTWALIGTPPALFSLQNCCFKKYRVPVLVSVKIFLRIWYFITYSSFKVLFQNA